MNQKILWLVSLYPNKLSPFNGDFIQRHARAVSLLREIEVIFVIKDGEGKMTKGVKEDVFQSENLTERIIYYKPLRTGIPILDKVISNTYYLWVFKKKIREYLQMNERPPFVHVHVAMKAGMLALWLKRKNKIPFILSEHWSGYLPEAAPGIESLNFIQKRYYHKIFRESVYNTTVSNYLGKAIRKRFGVDYEVIPNVVNTDIFYPSENTNHVTTRLIHISTNTKLKNTEIILKALAMVKSQGIAFRMSFILPDTGTFQLKVNDYNLKEEVSVHQEVPQKKLAQYLANSDALILFSKYETFGCVVIEANACGLPCILSDLEVFKEYSIEKVTALFAKSNDVNDLVRTILFFINNKKEFDKKQISEYTHNRFSYPVIARDFDELYKKLEGLDLINK